MAPLQISTPITFENLYNKYHKLIQSIDCICWYLCHVIQRVMVQITAAKNGVEGRPFITSSSESCSSVVSPTDNDYSCNQLESVELINFVDIKR